MNSQPASSATIVGTVKGNDNSTPFSVPTHRALWAGIRVDTWIGIRLSLPNAVYVFGGRERGRYYDQTCAWDYPKDRFDYKYLIL